MVIGFITLDTERAEESWLFIKIHLKYRSKKL